MSPNKKDKDTPDEATTGADEAHEAELAAARASVEGVKPEDIPNILDTRSDLPTEVRAELIAQHPVTPGAQPAPVTVKEQPMPIVTGIAEGTERNDPPIKRYRTTAHPELVVWHPNGENTIQFHNFEYATANAEWQAVLDRTPEVDGPVDEIAQQGGIEVTPDGRVVGLGGADVEPIRATDVVATA